MNILFLQAAPAPGQDDGMITMLFLAVGMIVFYFFIIRPQNKAQKDQKNFIDSMVKGKKVVTSGGIHGTIMDVQNDIVTLMIAPKTNITVQKHMISKELSDTL